MRKYKNDNLINEHKSVLYKTTKFLHNNTSAGTVLQAINGGKGRQACYRTFVDLRRLPDWCSAYEIVQTTTQRLLRLLSFPDFTPRRSPGSDHFTDVVVQSLRRDVGTITFKLFDAPLSESSAANFTIFATVGRR